MVQVFVFDLADGKTLDVCRGHAGILLVHPGFCLIVIESVLDETVDRTDGISVPLDEDLCHGSRYALREAVGLQASYSVLVESDVGIDVPVEVLCPDGVELAAQFQALVRDITLVRPHIRESIA